MLLTRFARWYKSHGMENPKRTTAPRRVVFFLDYPDFKKLRKMAYDQNTPMSRLIRDAVGAWLKPQKETQANG